MADRVLLISWGPPVRGREVRSLEVFNEAVGLFGSMQQGGRIESFDITIMRPNGHFNGYMQLHGSAAQLDAGPRGRATSGARSSTRRCASRTSATSTA